MNFSRIRSVAIIVTVLLLTPIAFASQGPAQMVRHQPTIASYLKPGLPLELVSARKADRIAWISYEAGLRNVFTAVAPAFTPVRVTSFMKDDGVDLTTLRISDDGSTVAFVRGSAPNSAGWVANPGGDPTAPTAPSGPRARLWPAARAGSPRAPIRKCRPTAGTCSM
jgi:hypothetical protein